MKMTMKTGVLLILLLGCAILQAAYFKAMPLSLSQPDGTPLSLFATGDEYYNWLHDADGYTVKQDGDGWYKYVTFVNDEIRFTSLLAGQANPAAANLTPWQNVSPQKMGEIRNQKQSFLQMDNTSRAPHTGAINNLVVFIRFSDQTEFGETIANYDTKFNGTTGNTMQSYFLEASYNALNISTTYYPTPTTAVVSWQDTNPRAYYSPYNATTNPTGYNGDAERTSREHTLLVNAVLGVRSQVPTSLNLDGDNDGNVDNVCFIIKGASDGWAELLWPHRWSLYSLNVTINSKRVYDYNFQLSEFTNSAGNGVLCHEMFHSLGSPDLYHYTGNGIAPVGSWDLMENNANPPQHMGAYMKWKYVGWIPSIPTISTPGTYTLNPLTSQTGNCYRINSPNSSAEYFVVEFRKKTGTFENSLPASGMLIYRINTAAGNGNASGPPDEVYVYRPGGSATENGSVSEAYFSDEAGRIMFNQYTNPWPYLQDGTTNGAINLMSIGSSAGATMNFTLSNTSPLTDLDEGFESGITTPPWSFSGNANWTVDTTTFYSGTKSAKSGTITHSQTSVIQMTQPIGYAGQISFFYKVSSESNYDYLKFYIDGVLKGQWSGEINWAMTAFNVTQGTHTFKWEYMKDGSVTSGSDCAWVDHIGWPVATYDPPQNLFGYPANLQAILSWSAPATGSPTSYKVFRNSVLLTTTTSLNYTDNAVTNGVTYTYYVKAVYTNPNGESVASNTVSVTPNVIMYATIGAGTAATGTTTASPINIYYRSSHGQSVYTAAELNAAGITGQINITQIGFNVISVPNLALPSFIVRMKTTTEPNVLNWQTPTGMTTVYSAATYMPTAGGYDMLTLSTPFLWNGIDNIVIDTAFGQVASWSQSGTVQYTSVTNGYRYTWNDDVDQTNVFTGGSTSLYRPNVKLTYVPAYSGPEITINPASLTYGTVMINTTSTRTFTIQNTGDQVLTGNITTPSGYSVALGARQTSKPDVTTLASAAGNRTGRNLLAYSVLAGTTSTFTVTFAPTAVQAYNGNVTITHNATGGDRTVALTGAGGKPTIGLSATTFTANLAPGMTNNQTLTISNTGNLTLNYALTVSGSPAWLMVNGGSAYNNNIVSGGAAQNVTVGFNTAGMAPATYNATIVCASNDPSALSQNITVTLTVRNPLAITAPAVGASWPGGSLRNIVFGYSGAGTSVNMYYSFDDGAVWIAGGSLNVALGSNTYGWIVPNFPSATCRIKIVDSIAPNVEKISNLFSIVAPALPLLTVTAPNGGESWDLNSVHNITWTHNLLHPQVMLYYSLDNGSGWTYINTVNTSALSYSWTTPNTTSTQCRIRIVDAVDSYALDASNNTFSIVNPAPPTIPADASVAYNSSTGAAAISWSASTGNPTGYNVYFADNIGFVGAVLLAYVPAPLTSYTDTLVNTRSWGFYKIAAVRN